jgi:D-aminoacyl-tRNA deacylase
MRAVCQRVSRASVAVDGKMVGNIGPGLLVLLAAAKDDDPGQAAWMADKIAGLRIFPDTQGKMNLSLTDVRGEILVVSQFTLYGDCRKGKRPSYSEAASPAEAEALYRSFIEALRAKEIPVQEGIFGAMMQVELVNDGPVTLIVEKER